MSDQRISLARLKDGSRSAWITLDTSAVLALVEAVEAAHAVDESSDISPEAIETAWEELAQALARFDFGERP